MTRSLFILPLLFFLIHPVFAQTCVPDSMYLDSAAGVFPAPVTMNNPDGGIDRPACKGEYYEYTLTVVIPDSATFLIGGSTVKVRLISAQIATEGAVKGLPPGLDYLCMPEDCIYEADSSGCILIYGTVPDSAEAKRYDLFINMMVTISGLGTIDIAFPGPQFPGQYFLEVAPPDSAVCTSFSSSERISELVFYPNPIQAGQSLKLKENQVFEFLRIYNMNGQCIRQLRNQQGVIPLVDIGPGFYMLEAKSLNGSVQYGKLLILD